jgi:hypothetical protein
MSTFVATHPSPNPEAQFIQPIPIHQTSIHPARVQWYLCHSISPLLSSRHDFLDKSADTFVVVLDDARLSLFARTPVCTCTPDPVSNHWGQVSRKPNQYFLRSPTNFKYTHFSLRTSNQFKQVQFYGFCNKIEISLPDEGW